MPATEASTYIAVMKVIEPGAARKPSKNKMAASRPSRRADGAGCPSPSPSASAVTVALTG